MKCYSLNVYFHLIVFSLVVFISSCDDKTAAPDIAFRLPGIPENVRVFDMLEGIKLTWDAPKSSIEVKNYIIERANYQGKEQELNFVVIENNFTAEKLEFFEKYATDVSGDAYIYRIYANNNEGKSAPYTLNAVIRNDFFAITDQPRQVLTPIKPVGNSMFGSNVAISNDGVSMAIVKLEKLKNSNNSAISEHSIIQIYNHDISGVWYSKPSFVLLGESEVVIPLYSKSLVFSPDGKTLAVNVSYDFSISNNSAASVHLYTRDHDGYWNTKPLIVLKSQSSEAIDFFGSVLSFSPDGKTLVVGDKSTAIAYLYTVNNTGKWNNIPSDILKSRSISSNLRYGFSLAFSSDNNTLAMGDTEDTIDDGIQVGSVQLFTKSTSGQWINSPTAILKSKKSGAGFGYSLKYSHDGNSLAVSEVFGKLVHGYEKNQQTGNVQIFTKDIAGNWNSIPTTVLISRGRFKKFGFLMAFNKTDDKLFITEHDSSIIYNDRGLHSVGTVQVYKKDSAGDWITKPQAVLTSATPDTSMWFGISMAYSSLTNTLVIGEHTKVVNIFDTTLLVGF